MTTCFISDLHLQDSRPEITAAFEGLLAARGGEWRRLFILGDLFEGWVGDDDDCSTAERVRTALRRLSERGVELYFCHGNRDFLVGDAFCAATGAQLLGEEELVTLGAHSALIMHGDSLCTQDLDYMAFRAQVRDSDWQARFLTLPLAERRTLVGNMREISARTTASQAMHISDVNQTEVEARLRAREVALLIHGHTHRPAIHDFDLAGDPAKRIVLGDWDSHGWTLTFDSNGDFELKKFRLQPRNGAHSAKS